MIAMQPFAAILSIIIFLITFFLYRYVSLSSIVSSIFFPLVIISLNDVSSINSSLLLFSIFVPILSLITHQKNIERLIRGEEIKSTFGKNK